MLADGMNFSTCWEADLDFNVKDRGLVTCRIPNDATFIIRKFFFSKAFVTPFEDRLYLRLSDVQRLKTDQCNDDYSFFQYGKANTFLTKNLRTASKVTSDYAPDKRGYAPVCLTNFYSQV